MTSYQEKVKKLRQIGAISVDLRHKLTPGIKGLITRRYDQYSSILNNLQDFAIRTVDKKTAKSIPSLAYDKKLKSGKHRVLIYAPGLKVRIRNGKIEKSGAMYHETLYPAGKDIFKSAETLFKKKLSKHEYIMISIGGSRPFNRVFYDLASLNNYIKNWSAKESGADRDDLINHMSLVKIYDTEHDKEAVRPYSGRRKTGGKEKRRVKGRGN